MSHLQSRRTNPPPQSGSRLDIPISNHRKATPDSVSRHPVKSARIQSAEHRQTGVESSPENVSRSRKSALLRQTQPKSASPDSVANTGHRRTSRRSDIVSESVRGASSGTSQWLRACSAAVAAEESFSEGQWKHALKALLQLRSLPGLRPIDQRWIERQIELCQDRLQGGAR